MVSWSVQALSWRIQFKFLRRFVNILNACVSKKTWTPKNGCLEDPFSIPQALFFCFNVKVPTCISSYSNLSNVRVPTCISSLLLVNFFRVSHGISVQTGQPMGFFKPHQQCRWRSQRQAIQPKAPGGFRVIVLPTQTMPCLRGKSLEVTIPKQSCFFFKGKIPQVLSFVYFVLLDSPKMGKFNDPLYQYNLKWPYMHAFRVVVNGSKDTPIWHWRLPIHTLQPNTTPSFLCLWNLTCLDAQSFNLYSTFSFPTFDVWWDFQSFGWRRPVWPETLRNWQPRPSGRRWWLRRQRGRARCKWQHG